MSKKKRVNTQTTFLKIIIALSIVGILTSIYLVQNHYAPPEKGAFCDLGETISCSLVNTSVYSVLFNVPVALLGALWFVIVSLMAWKALKRDGTLMAGLLGWSVLGTLFVIYFVIAEIILKAICPFCTLVHLIVLTTLVLSILLYQKQKLSKKKIMKALKPWIVGIVILNLIPLIVFNFPAGEKENYDELAKCITAKEINMYSSFRCGFCAKTKGKFDDSFQYINEIECHPQGPNPQTELCTAKDIQGTPTWILEPNGVEVKRNTGFLSIKELRDFSGC